MASPQRQARVYALKSHFESHILMLTEEINLFLDNPVGVTGHPEFFKTIEDKVCEIAELEGAIAVLDRHFK